MTLRLAGCAICMVLAACGGQQPQPEQIIAAVTEAVQRQAAATRLLDTRIATAERWRMEEPISVTLLGEPRPDGADAWTARVLLRGRWTGLVIVGTQARPTVDADGVIQWPPAQRQQISQEFDAVADVRILRGPDGTYSVP